MYQDTSVAGGLRSIYGSRAVFLTQRHEPVSDVWWCLSKTLLPVTCVGIMASDAYRPVYEASRRQVAPWWHTCLLFLILLMITLFGMWSQHRNTPGPAIAAGHSEVVPLYVSLILMLWALFLFVRFGFKKGGTTVGEVVGVKRSDWRSIVRDVAIAIPFWIVWEAAGRFTHFILGPDQAKKIDILLPQTILEILLWVGVSVSAGICEEMSIEGICRGSFWL